ncbi:hypothetical protein JR316_0007379 [Psilocybe cubensis]|uniref:Uncharacterized protein n=1 Tax=Psilocybe cubensis TaxID=181762 RepID=A0ACB8GZ99_PSICU|nr:hypothetical protein JR316_0007379 [Psilocybe cubensis]KAH9480779.1 hypothetical protein JR316_0007379 [Psilocybe cubensis]
MVESWIRHDVQTYQTGHKLSLSDLQLADGHKDAQHNGHYLKKVYAESSSSILLPEHPYFLHVSEVSIQIPDPNIESKSSFLQQKSLGGNQYLKSNWSTDDFLTTDFLTGQYLLFMCLRPSIPSDTNTFKKIQLELVCRFPKRASEIVTLTPAFFIHCHVSPSPLTMFHAFHLIVFKPYQPQKHGRVGQSTQVSGFLQAGDRFTTSGTHISMLQIRLKALALASKV